MISRKTFVFFLFATVLAFGLTANFVRQVVAKENGDTDTYRSLKAFTDVLSLVQKNYVKEVKISDLVEGAIKGMLSSLDPHSSYLTPDTYRDLQVETKGEFGGLGIEITVKDGLLTVVAPIEDSPAARAGVQSGDQIIKIGEEFTRDLSLMDAVKKMRGPKGSPINISVHREGLKELIAFSIVRDVIKVKSVRYRPLEDGFGLVRLTQFQEGSADEFLAAVKDLEKKAGEKKLRGLVIDVRNNPGGLLNEAVRVSDLFLDDGVIVYTDGRLESQKQKYYAHKDGSEPAFPIITLINNGSASASEILAGSLQDAGRALILGTQTFGKGSVQTVLPLENDGALRLTTALYYTKSGRAIQAAGVTPDIVVQPKKTAKELGGELEKDDPIKEKNLPGALRNPNAPVQLKGEEELSGPKETKKDAKPVELKNPMTMNLNELLTEDVQLAEALRLLKTWHVFKGKPTIQAQQGTDPNA